MKIQSSASFLVCCNMHNKGLREDVEVMRNQGQFEISWGHAQGLRLDCWENNYVLGGEILQDIGDGWWEANSYLDL